MDDYSKGFSAYHKIPVLENSHIFKPNKPLKFYDYSLEQILLCAPLLIDLQYTLILIKQYALANCPPSATS